MGPTRIRCSKASGLFFFIMMIVALSSCSNSNQKDIIPPAEYAPYVNAYTGGVISQNSSIRIELTQDQPMVDLSNELKDHPFHFSPSIKGKAYWINNNTIEFVPEEGSLKSGEFYEGTFQLGNYVEVDKRLKKFNFSFRVQERNFILHSEPMSVTATQPDAVTVKGTIHFSDAVKKEEVDKMLSVSNGGNSPIKIIATDNPTHYEFVINQVPRKQEDYQLKITANGKVTDINRIQEEEVFIPAKGNFRFLSAERIDQPENGIEVVFSDPVSNTQDLKGLIEVPEVASSIMQIKDNKVYIYFEANQLNQLTLKIHEGIKSNQEKTLNTSHSISFSEQKLKPQVEMSTSAAILPNSRSLIIPFRAVNLYAVDINIIRIFENKTAWLSPNSLIVKPIYYLIIRQRKDFPIRIQMQKIPKIQILKKK